MQAIRQEHEFKLFFEVIFPASDLGLKDYRDTALLRIQRLTGKDAEVIIQIYKRFKGLIWLKSDLGTKDYNKAVGEACLIDLMHSKQVKQCNLASTLFTMN